MVELCWLNLDHPELSEGVVQVDAGVEIHKEEILFFRPLCGNGKLIDVAVSEMGVSNGRPSIRSRAGAYLIGVGKMGPMESVFPSIIRCRPRPTSNGESGHRGRASCRLSSRIRRSTSSCCRLVSLTVCFTAMATLLKFVKVHPQVPTTNVGIQMRVKELWEDTDERGSCQTSTTFIVPLVGTV